MRLNIRAKFHQTALAR